MNKQILILKYLSRIIISKQIKLETENLQTLSTSNQMILRLTILLTLAASFGMAPHFFKGKGSLVICIDKSPTIWSYRQYPIISGVREKSLFTLLMILLVI